MNRFWVRTQVVSLCMVAIFLTGCVANHGYNRLDLASVSIVDQNGMSETISNADRLKQYQGVNFLSSQPYQKVMRVYNRDANGNVVAYITSYHPNGQIKQYLEVVNGRAYGKYQEWLHNGQLKVEACVIGGEGDIGMAAEKTWLFDGCCKAWDEEGCLAAEIMYSKGSLEGNTFHYHPNGKIWKCIPYENNRTHGTAEYFLEDSTLLQTNTYVNGEKNGVARRYWGNGEIAAEETYDKGILQQGTYFDNKGKMIAQVQEGEGVRALFNKESVAELQEYHEGVPEGLVQVFADNGALVSVYHVKEGVKHGEEIEYFESRFIQKKPLPKLMMSWVQGSIQGICKTWYLNGVQESQREISNNAKNGLATAWYEDGGVMLMEQYESDILVRGKYFKRGDKIAVSEVRDGRGTATLFDGKGNFLRKIEYQNGRPF